MDIIDKTNLASAYAAAWLAVKGRQATVTVDPHGWFTVNKGIGVTERVRASARPLWVSRPMVRATG